MVWRISAGDGPLAGPEPAAAEVSRCGGSARSWGARLACLTRFGSPIASPSGPAALDPGPPSPGSIGSGPVWRDSSQGGPDAFPARGEATGVIGVGGPAGAVRPSVPGPGEPPATLRPVHPGNEVGCPGYGAEPAPGCGPGSRRGVNMSDAAGPASAISSG